MRIFIILAVAMFGIVGCVKSPEPDVIGAPELHVIGIDKGYGTRNPDHVDCRELCTQDRDCQIKCRRENPRWIHDTKVQVEVSRPRKSVTLILAAHAPIQWQVTRQRKTEIDRIILIGYHADKASVKINGKPHDDVVWQKGVVAPTFTEGYHFRAFVDKVPSELGFEKLSSFQGPHQSGGTPEAGFIIADVQTDNPALEPDYLKYKIQPIDTRLDLRLSGKISGQSGEFLPDGTLTRTLDLIPTTNLAVSANGQKGYRYVGNGIRTLLADDEDGGDADLIALPGEEFDLGHFTAISLDEKRNQLLASFQAGGSRSEIMALDLETKTWREFASTDEMINSFFYDSTNDKYLVCVRNFFKDVLIGSLDPVSGQFKVLSEIKDEAFDGMSDLYGDQPAVYIIGLSGQHIVLAVDGRDIYSGPNDEAGGFRRVYILDLNTGAVKLTYYD